MVKKKNGNKDKNGNKINGDKKKEEIVPPSEKDASNASDELKRGSGPGGRVMADVAVAKGQGAKR